MPLSLQRQSDLSFSRTALPHRLLQPCPVSSRSLWSTRRSSTKQCGERPKCVLRIVRAHSIDARSENDVSTNADCPGGYRIRSATTQDADQIGKLTAQAFAWLASEDMQPGPIRDYTVRAEFYYQQSIYQDSVEILKRSLQSKEAARRSSREVVLREQSRQLRAELARLQGRPLPGRPIEDRLQRVAMQSWRRKRQFTCLVVEEPSTGDIVASCVLSLAAPDALLPPPFPTTKPWRLYCSNMAVNPAHRRKGLATAVLRRCQKIGRLWGHKTMWLHVNIINSHAQHLYKAAGFDIKSQDKWYHILSRKRYLMSKALPAKARHQQAAGLTVTGGAVRSNDGVFIWDVVSDAPAAAIQTGLPSDAPEPEQ